MRDDASRETGDSRDSREADGSGDQSGMAPWDETMHSGGTGEESDDGAEDRSSGNVAGEFRPSGPIEPGTPSLENSLFVVFGAYVAILGLTRLFIDAQGFDGRDVLVITGGTLLVSLALFGFFGLLTPDT